MSNVLALTGSVFMLTVYDRVIPSGSLTTLGALGILCIVAYAIQATIDIFRGRILSRAGLSLRASISPPLFDLLVRDGSHRGDSGVSVRDLDQITGFLSSLGPAAFFDLPWLPLYLLICFAFHPLVGIVVSLGAILLVLMAVLTSWLTSSSSRHLADITQRRGSFLSRIRDSADVLVSMGMIRNVGQTWSAISAAYVDHTGTLADVTTVLGIMSRVIRMLLQSGVLAVGAYLVISGDATGGIMIASSILSARALAPIEQVIVHWRPFASARVAWRNLEERFAGSPQEPAYFIPPKPAFGVHADRLTLLLPRSDRVVIRQASFKLVHGDTLAILGPTGSGKSSLARALVGLWEPAAGGVRYDTFPLQDWPSEARGAFIGYLPQSPTLFEGTIAQNIARFGHGIDEEEIVRTARLAGVHELISRLPEGYGTRIGDAGSGLSGGQVQRIALARALFGNPFLVVLDEPNSNLDSDGDAALAEALTQLRDRGAVTVVVTHRPNLMPFVTHVLVLSNGVVQQFGPRDDVLGNLQANRTGVSATAAGRT